ncbi:hypothetical protein MBANPS3_000424 [Mucor bainieri]
MPSGKKKNVCTHIQIDNVTEYALATRQKSELSVLDLPQQQQQQQQQDSEKLLGKRKQSESVTVCSP